MTKEKSQEAETEAGEEWLIRLPLEELKRQLDACYRRSLILAASVLSAIAGLLAYAGF